MKIFQRKNAIIISSPSVLSEYWLYFGYQYSICVPLFLPFFYLSRLLFFSSLSSSFSNICVVPYITFTFIAYLFLYVHLFALQTSVFTVFVVEMKDEVKNEADNRKIYRRHDSRRDVFWCLMPTQVSNVGQYCVLTAIVEPLSVLPHLPFHSVWHFVARTNDVLSILHLQECFSQLYRSAVSCGVRSLRFFTSGSSRSWSFRRPFI